MRIDTWKIRQVIFPLINSDKSSKFKKFDYPDDDDEFDLEDLFSEMNSNTFNFHGFPPGVLKQFQEIIEAMQDFDEEPQNSQRQRFFENKYNEFRQKTDQDLDGVYADQLDSLLKRISPDLMPKPKTPNAQQKLKLTDEEKIMDIIHGTFIEEVVPVKPRKRHVQKIPASPHHFGGLPPFDLPPSSASRNWQSKTVMTIRKADGSYETRKTERTQDGQTKTTITKTGSDGTARTQSFFGDGQAQSAVAKSQPTNGNHAERNLILYGAYKIPCLW